MRVNSACARAPDVTHIQRTEKYAKEALGLIEQELGGDNIALTLGYVGMIHSNFPVNAVYQWSRGPEEVILNVKLAEKFKISDEELKNRLQRRPVALLRPTIGRIRRAALLIKCKLKFHVL